MNAGPSETPQATQKIPHPFVITTSANSLLDQRRSLYEAVLAVEQQDAVVVDRHLPVEDIVLSPSTCLCLRTVEDLQLVSKLTICTTSCTYYLH